MDVLDILIDDAVPLAIETVEGNVSRTHYYDGEYGRAAVLGALSERRRETVRLNDAVYLVYLAHPNAGDAGWRRLSDLRF